VCEVISLNRPPSHHLTKRKQSPLLNLANDLIDDFDKVIDVIDVQTGHADASVLGHVDMRLFAKLDDLRLRQTREAKHAYLLRDVVPSAGRA